MIHWKKFHYLVPSCPKCKSPYTGRLIYGNGQSEFVVVQRYLDKGERVRITNSSQLPYHNCYCEDCGIYWHENIKPVLYTKKEWDEICENIQVKEDAVYYRTAKYLSQDEYKLQKRKNRIKIIKRIGKTSLYFLFGIDTNRIKKQYNEVKEKIKH